MSKFGKSMHDERGSVSHMKWQETLCSDLMKHHVCKKWRAEFGDFVHSMGDILSPVQKLVQAVDGESLLLFVSSFWSRIWRVSKVTGIYNLMPVKQLIESKWTYEANDIFTMTLYLVVFILIKYKTIGEYRVNPFE